MKKMKNNPFNLVFSLTASADRKYNKMGYKFLGAGEIPEHGLTEVHVFQVEEMPTCKEVKIEGWIEDENEALVPFEISFEDGFCLYIDNELGDHIESLDEMIGHYGDFFYRSKEDYKKDIKTYFRT